jgi:rhodanese-related sulfurtransferase
VCTPAEYNEKHIAGVRNVPLDEIARRVQEFSGKKTVYVHCRSGNRSAKAIDLLKSLGVKAELVNVSGGLMAWGKAGFETLSLTHRMPIMQQTLLAAGSLTLAGYILSAFVHPAFILLSVAIGAGLTFAGLTGWCGMSYALSKMPWNK